MQGFVKVAKLTDLDSRDSIEVSGNGLDRVGICIAKVDGRLYALTNVCTHKGAPMNEGIVSKKNIICPWHKAFFKLDTGENYFPADRPLRTFEVKVEDDSIYLRIPDMRAGEQAKPKPGNVIK